MRRFLRILATLLGVVALAGTGAYFVFGYAPAPSEPPLTGTLQSGSLETGGRTRTFLTYVPRVLTKGAPLMLALHGSTLDGRGMRRYTGDELDVLADARGFVVAYPDGYRGNWNDCRKRVATPAQRENVDDVAFLGALVQRLARTQGIDPHRVYAFGYSNGGQMAVRLLSEAPGFLAGAALAGVSLPVPENLKCAEPGASPPIVMVNGTRDPLIPFPGGEATLFGLFSRGFVRPVDETARAFAAGNHLAPEAAITVLPHADAHDPTSVERRVWSRDGQPWVVQYVVMGGGHVVPQPRFRAPRALGRATFDLDFPGAAVDFFLGSDRALSAGAER